MRSIFVLLLIAGLMSPASAFASSSVVAQRSDGICGLATTPAGGVFVADCGAGTVQRLDAAGAVAQTYGSRGSGNDQYDGISSIAVDSFGSVFVASSSKLVKYAADGGHLWTVTLSAGLYDVAAGTSGDLWVLTADTVLRLSGATGAQSASFSTGGSSLGARSAWQIAPAPEGDVWLTRGGGEGQQRVERRVPTGGLTASLTDVPVGGQSAAVAPNGTTYFSGFHRRIDRRTSQGAKVASFAMPEQFGGHPSGDIQQLAATDDVVYAVAPDGRTLVRIDLAVPNPALAGPTAPVVTGEPVRLDASGSTADLTTIASYAWDLDGDGSFETTTGTTSSVQTSFASAGTRQVSVRASTPEGGDAIASVPVDVRLAPPSATTGISINNGDQFTNDPRVTLRVSWSPFSTRALVSNDGGFANALSFGLAPELPWTLDSSGPERLPKTIYARFDATGSQTFQDDIILDQVPPTIIAATVAISGSLRAAAGTRTVTLSAADDNSGVETVQGAANSDVPLATVPYAATLRLPAAATRVRVRDRAGNWSSWRKLERNVARLVAATVKRGRALRVEVTAAKAALMSVKILRSRAVVARRIYELDRGTQRLRVSLNRLRRGAYVARFRFAGESIDLSFRIR